MDYLHDANGLFATVHHDTVGLAAEKKVRSKVYTVVTATALDASLLTLFGPPAPSLQVGSLSHSQGASHTMSKISVVNPILQPCSP